MKGEKPSDMTKINSYRNLNKTGPLFKVQYSLDDKIPRYLDKIPPDNLNIGIVLPIKKLFNTTNK